MGRCVARTTIKKVIRNGIDLTCATVGVPGLASRESCPDICNNKVIDIIRELQDFGIRVVAEDPYADAGDPRARPGGRAAGARRRQGPVRSAGPDAAGDHCVAAVDAGPGYDDRSFDQVR